MLPPPTSRRLDDSTLECIGKTVYAKPVNGWGWSEGYGWRQSGFNDDQHKSVRADVPAPFHFEIAEFFDWNGDRQGGIGFITEHGHIYAGYWLLFSVYSDGEHNFLSKIAHHRLHIGEQRPSLYPPSHFPKMAEYWPLPRFPDIPAVGGWGQIGLSKEAIDEFNRNRVAEAKRTHSSKA